MPSPGRWCLDWIEPLDTQVSSTVALIAWCVGAQALEHCTEWQVRTKEKHCFSLPFS